MSKTGQSRGHPLFRACAFNQHDVEDLDLEERVPFRLEEFASLIDGRLNNRIDIAGKRDLRAVRLEEVLIDVETRAEGFQRGFQPLDRIFLLTMIQAFV